VSTWVAKFRSSEKNLLLHSIVPVTKHLRHDELAKMNQKLCCATTFNNNNNHIDKCRIKFSTLRLEGFMSPYIWGVIPRFQSTFVAPLLYFVGGGWHACD
jgi:hypothetical protein